MADPNVLADMVFAPLNLADSSGVQAPVPVSVSASPFVYRATSRQALHITGGTISAVSYARGSTSLAIGLVSGGQLFELNAGDTLTVTYVTAPTITMIPR